VPPWCGQHAHLRRRVGHGLSPIDETYTHARKGEAFSHRQTYSARGARDNRKVARRDRFHHLSFLSVICSAVRRIFIKSTGGRPPRGGTTCLSALCFHVARTRHLGQVLIRPCLRRCLAHKKPGPRTETLHATTLVTHVEDW
jgi:hypothetical protein